MNHCNTVQHKTLYKVLELGLRKGFSQCARLEGNVSHIGCGFNSLLGLHYWKQKRFPLTILYCMRAFKRIVLDVMTLEEGLHTERSLELSGIIHAEAPTPQQAVETLLALAADAAPEVWDGAEKDCLKPETL